MLAALAWRNLWRQPWRTGLSLCSIALAGAISVFLLSLQLGAYATMKESVLRLVDGFAQVEPPGYAADPSLRRAIADPADLLARIDAIAAVTAAAPRASTYAVLSAGARSYAGEVLGVEPRLERQVSALPATITAGRYLSPADADAAVIGVRLARNLGLTVGGRLTLLGSARDGSIAADILTVVGIFSTGALELDRQAIEMPLARFREDFAMGSGANVLVVSGRSLAAIQSALPALRRIARQRDLVVRDWVRLEPALHDVILLDMSFSVLLYASLIVIVVFVILNTLLMSVLERTREFGVLLALGMRPGQIGRMVWLELLILAGLGAAAGIVLGAGATAAIAVHGIDFRGAEALFSQWHMPSTLYPQLGAVSATAGPLAILLSVGVAGLVPHLRLRRLQPVAAMKAT